MEHTIKHLIKIPIIFRLLIILAVIRRQRDKTSSESSQRFDAQSQYITRTSLFGGTRRRAKRRVQQGIG